MAPRRPSPQREPPQLTIEQKRNRITRLERCIAELEAFDIQTIQKRFSSEVSVLQTDIEQALAAAFGEGTPTFQRYEGAARLDQAPVFLGTTGGWHGGSDGFQDIRETEEARKNLREGRTRSIALLRSAIQTLEDEIADASPAIRTSPPTIGNKVFVVHGHDEGAKHGVARFLEKLGLEAIILGEQPDRGRTIIEKFEDHAGDVGFAVVLLTPDDVGQSKTVATGQERARQNVVFELGYFVGKLGRGRACLLRKGAVEIPSDLAGVIYTEMDDHNGWQSKLVQELKAAKMEFDANRLWT
ncbi:nucleotide-binding protein [Acidisoma cellulosilytica]|uniref:Nucleotide-binding protein n=1 Tax=Acidisoma cellulosilyticum TaxID=2802395 RepID=A0A963Z7J6_9PROT|nr:nucleotide-binding protein [Acidisoma cellulosilyticum]MCB8884023.1 nucleotide-binding protein [Acidisoma cellulosilyticum]